MAGRNFQDLKKPGMNYHTATDEVIMANGGRNPKCPYCGEEMFPIDDHGRFACSCKLSKRR